MTNNNSTPHTPFPCVNCGACCETIGRIPTMRRAGYCESPDTDRCKFLRYVPKVSSSPAIQRLSEALEKSKVPLSPLDAVPEGLAPGDSYCSIYPNRPAICRVNGSLRPPKVSDTDWYLTNLEHCGTLAIRAASVPDSKLIAIDTAITKLKGPQPPHKNNLISFPTAPISINKGRS